MLQRVYDPTFGHISIDGINIRSVNRKSLRKSLATVFQDASLFNRSIYNNISIGRANATDEELYEAAKIAATHDFILKKLIVMIQWLASEEPNYQVEKGND